MSECKLCKVNEADQTGSHITSAFLLVSQIGKRGEEISYLITTNPNQNYSENQGNKGLIEDLILCRDCESKLSFIENIFSSEVTHKIVTENYKENFPSSQKNGLKYLCCNRINPITFHLFIYSLIWRAHISSLETYSNFILADAVEEELRFVLDLFLPTFIDHKSFLKRNEWEKMVENCQELFSYFPYFICKSENYPNKSETLEFFDNISKSPYNIMINEYILLPFLNTIEFTDDFFGVKDKISLGNALNNNYDLVKVSILSNEDYSNILKMIFQIGAEKRIKEIESECIIELTQQGLPLDPAVIKKMIINRVNQIKFDPPKE